MWWPAAAGPLAGVTAAAPPGSPGLTLQRPLPRPLPTGPLLSPPQVSIRLDGENRAVEYNAVGAIEAAVRAVFRGPRVSDLFDRDWHKLALSVQAPNVSLYIDCTLVQTLPIGERENIDIRGKAVIGKRLHDSVPIDVSARPAARALGATPPLARARRALGPSFPWPGLAGPLTRLPRRSPKSPARSPSLTLAHSLTHSAIQPVIYHVCVWPPLCGRHRASTGDVAH